MAARIAEPPPLSPPAAAAAAPRQGLRIAVVEDYEPLCRQFVEHLRREGHAARGVDCGEALDTLMAGWMPQLLVLDLNLPLEDGLSISRRMRSAHPELGIVMVTVRRASAEREEGYRHGADIVLPKPLQPSELSAAIGALQRRLLPAEPAGGWRLDARSRRLQLPDGRQLPLTHFEAQALAALARAPQQRLHHETLAEAVTPEGEPLRKESLEVGFSRLRAKLAEWQVAQPLVKAVRGYGYACCVHLTLGAVPPLAAPTVGLGAASSASAASLGTHQGTTGAVTAAITGAVTGAITGATTQAITSAATPAATPAATAPP